MNQMKTELDRVVLNFFENTSEELEKFIQEIAIEPLIVAKKLILTSEKKGGRVHVTGIGKPGHVAEYIASLFSSTGTPAYFLDGTEAIHGSSGQVKSGDIVLSISNSGETEELKKQFKRLNKMGLALFLSPEKRSHGWQKIVIVSFLLVWKMRAIL